MGERRQKLLNFWKSQRGVALSQFVKHLLIHFYLFKEYKPASGVTASSGIYTQGPPLASDLNAAKITMGQTTSSYQVRKKKKKIL